MPSMDKEDFEIRLIQNASIGAAALSAFAISFFEEAKKTAGPKLPLMYIILPLVFHLPTARIIASTKKSSGLLKALEKDRTLHLGLQQRMIDIANMTEESLIMAARMRTYLF